MGKASIKENKNIYQVSRENSGLSRESASSAMETMSVDRIYRIENDQCIPRPEEVCLMAEKYCDPSLYNHYCSRQCRIGEKFVPHVEIKELSYIVLEMLASLNRMQDDKNKLIEIAADGKIDEGEIDDFIHIQDELKRISVTVDALNLWTEKMLACGMIDVDLYEQRKKKF